MEFLPVASPKSFRWIRQNSLSFLGTSALFWVQGILVCIVFHMGCLALCRWPNLGSVNNTKVLLLLVSDLTIAWAVYARGMSRYARGGHSIMASATGFTSQGRFISVSVPTGGRTPIDEDRGIIFGAAALAFGPILLLPIVLLPIEAISAKNGGIIELYYTALQIYPWLVPFRGTLFLAVSWLPTSIIFAALEAVPICFGLSFVFLLVANWACTGRGVLQIAFRMAVYFVWALMILITLDLTYHILTTHKL